MGGVVVGKTNLPEFCAGSHSFNKLFNTCVNPWDTRTSAAGSSGGSASALASCICWLAHGSDLGGSLRTPAAFNGVVAFRTTPGTVPQRGPCNPHPYALFATDGPMARTVLDTAIFLDTMTNRSLLDDDDNDDDADEMMSSDQKKKNKTPKPMPGWEDLPMVPQPLATRNFESWQQVAELGLAQAKEKSASFRVAFSTLRVNAVTSETERLCRRAAELLASDKGTLTHVEEPFDARLANLLFIILRSVGYNAKFGNKSVLTPEQYKRCARPRCIPIFTFVHPSPPDHARQIMQLTHETKANNTREYVCLKL